MEAQGGFIFWAEASMKIFRDVAGTGELNGKERLDRLGLFPGAQEVAGRHFEVYKIMTGKVNTNG